MRKERRTTTRTRLLVHLNVARCSTARHADAYRAKTLPTAASGYFPRLSYQEWKAPQGCTGCNFHADESPRESPRWRINRNYNSHPRWTLCPRPSSTIEDSITVENSTSVWERRRVERLPLGREARPAASGTRHPPKFSARASGNKRRRGYGIAHG